MIRAAAYGRFSTDLQSDRSIEDQLALCRSFAERNDMTIVASFHDRAKSGASMIGRDGLLTMMEAARNRQFEVVVVEALDRLSRDQEDLAGIYKRLSFAGVRIIAVHDGQADPVQIGVRGLLGSLYLTDLANKVRRGMNGVIRDGRHAGGKAYGYRPVAGEPGRLEIDEAEAGVVRRIFTEYADGSSPRAIAKGLNADGIAPPRGTVWNASTINGNDQRGNGILHNRLYVGEIIWNKVRMVRDPMTGKRISRVNAEKDWHRAQAPHLAIVERDLFDRVQRHKTARSDAGRRNPRAKHLLSGLLRCGACGSGMSIAGTDRGRRRVQCSRHKESGSCGVGQKFYLDAIEKAVLSNLAKAFSDEAIMAECFRAYRDEMREQISGAVRNRDASARRAREVGDEIDRVMRLYTKGLIDEARAEGELRRLRDEEAELRAELDRASRAVPVIELHPEMVSVLRAEIAATIDRLADHSEDEPDIAPALRNLIDAVIVSPGHPPQIEVAGKLAALASDRAAFQLVAGVRSGLESRSAAGLLRFGPFMAA